MQVFRTIEEMRAFSLKTRASQNTLALVPTMGALHAGHISLVELAASLADNVVVSIYVNPTQFAANEDFDSYPRPLEADIAKCETAGAQAVFCPSHTEMYAPDHSTYVEETRLSLPLCGLSRPSHFRGVTTVVMKLFNIVTPHSAVFGRKDAQQARVIMRMVRDMNCPVEIHLAPTVRESDGLALSSRNVHLSADERSKALAIPAALNDAKARITRGITDIEEIKAAMHSVLAGAAPQLEIDYMEILSSHNLEPVSELSGELLIALAARVGKTRLIDNIEVSLA